MIATIKKYLALFLTYFLFYCSGASVYVPHTIPTPEFEKEGQVQISFNKSQFGYDPFIGYSFFNDVAAFGGLSFATSDSIKKGHKHIFGELGLVYFIILDDFFGSKKYSKTNINIITAFGRGSASGNFDQLTPDINNYDLSSYGTGQYNRYYLQLNFSRKMESAIRNLGLINRRKTLSSTYGYATRFSNIIFSKIYNDALTVNKSFSQSFWENTAFYKLAYNNLIFEFQIGVIKPLGEGSIIKYNSIHSSLGISYILPN